MIKKNKTRHSVKPNQERIILYGNPNLGSKHHNWKGVGDIPKSYFLKVFYHARDTHRELSITIEDMWHQFQKQNGKCALSGLELKFGGTGRHSKKGKELSETTASLDRIDSSKGYIKNNIQWIHKDINFMKQENTDEYFIQMCRKIAEYNDYINCETPIDIFNKKEKELRWHT